MATLPAPLLASLPPLFALLPLPLPEVVELPPLLLPDVVELVPPLLDAPAVSPAPPLPTERSSRPTMLLQASTNPMEKVAAMAELVGVSALIISPSARGQDVPWLMQRLKQRAHKPLSQR